MVGSHDPPSTTTCISNLQLLTNSSQSLRIVPADSHASSFSHIRPKAKGAPSAPGLHDTLRAGVGSNALDTYSPDSASSSAHPLEARLKAWEATQENVRMESLRRTFGIAEPVRRGMELKIVREGEWRPLALGGGVASVHEEILRGKDDSITWEDVYSGEEQRAVVPVHDELERKLKI